MMDFCVEYFGNLSKNCHFNNSVWWKYIRVRFIQDILHEPCEVYATPTETKTL